jgi:large subunit ribosomal protein L25
LDIIDLKVTERKGTGKGQARTLRSQGLVPAVLYGPDTETISLTVPAMEISRVFKQSESEHVILNLIIDNGGTRQKTVMIKELQTLPTTNEYLHVDFYEISMDRKITVKVPVEVIGKSEGIERGGNLQIVRHQLDVSCLPADIPAKIEVDISKLDIGDSVHVEEIVVGENVELLYDNNFTVVAVAAPTVEKAPVAEEEVEGVEPAEVEQPAETTSE